MLVLASQSPRRREILERAGIPFVVRLASVDESRLGAETPDAHVRRLAREKAESVPASAGEIVLAADTVVVVGDEILGKPSDPSDAVRMLRMLSGREHRVLTGICLRTSSRAIVDVASTRVRFVPVSESEIRQYVAGGEPMDKAGAYAVQGLASRYIDRIEGCYFNVVGLPVALVYRHLRGIES